MPKIEISSLFLQIIHFILKGNLLSGLEQQKSLLLSYSYPLL